MRKHVTVPIKAFHPQFLLNENFAYLSDIAKDIKFFF